MLSRVEHEKKLITSGPDCICVLSLLSYSVGLEANFLACVFIFPFLCENEPSFEAC